MPYSFSNFESAAAKTKERLVAEFGALRTGRANPVLVKDIQVEYYGSKTKLESLASIGVEDARTLIVQPWDKQSTEAIEKAIRNSNIGLQPIVDSTAIRLVLPELTGERRQALLKIASEKLEEARISLRKARDESWKDIQEREREKELSEDEKFRLKDELQKKMDSLNGELDDMAEKKRKEVGG